MKFQLGDRVRFVVKDGMPDELDCETGTIVEVWDFPGEFHYAVALDIGPIDETWSANDEDLEKI